ncbi:unknown [Alistipes finegoldii CAG:68]|nr:unknown [Alistipes finegoldii CAG:68]
MQVTQAAADKGVGDLVLLTDELVEIVDGLGELLVQKTRDAAAVIGSRQVGTQLDGFSEVLQRVVVVAQPRAGDGAVGVGLRVDRIHADRGREIGFGAQQVVEVVFGDAAQEIAFEGVFVETQQGVERADGLLVIVVHHARTSDPEKIFPVVLCIRFRPAHQRGGKGDSQDIFTHFPTHLSL